MLKLFLEILKTLERFLDRRRRVTSEGSAKHRKAVESVWDVVRETEAYLYDLRQGAKEDRGREAKLSRLWAQTPRPGQPPRPTFSRPPSAAA